MISRDRPLRVLTAIGGLRDVVVGTGFLLGSREIIGLQLYQNYNLLIAGISAPIAGIIFLLAGVVALVAAWNDWPVFAKYALWTQSLIWLFSGLMYLLSGDLFHAIVFGFLFSMPAAWIAIHYKYRVTWARERAELKKEIEELRKLIRGP